MKNTAIVTGMILALGLASSVGQGPPEGERGGRGGRGGPGGGGSNKLMTTLDKNGDGTLDSGEIQRASLSLRELDTNKDFKLTPDELGIRSRGDMSQRLMEMDANKDGKLTAEEIPERMQRFIERMDTNGDGAIDKAEMDAFQTEMRRRWEEGGQGRGGRGEGGGQPRGGPPQD